jgi:hypothetical protein
MRYALLVGHDEAALISTEERSRRRSRRPGTARLRCGRSGRSSRGLARHRRGQARAVPRSRRPGRSTARARERAPNRGPGTALNGRIPGSPARPDRGANGPGPRRARRQQPGHLGPDIIAGRLPGADQPDGGHWLTGPEPGPAGPSWTSCRLLGSCRGARRTARKVARHLCSSAPGSRAYPSGLARQGLAEDGQPEGIRTR